MGVGWIRTHGLRRCSFPRPDHRRPRARGSARASGRRRVDPAARTGAPGSTSPPRRSTSSIASLRTGRRGTRRCGTRESPYGSPRDAAVSSGTCVRGRRPTTPAMSSWTREQRASPGRTWSRPREERESPRHSWRGRSTGDENRAMPAALSISRRRTAPPPASGCSTSPPSSCRSVEPTILGSCRRRVLPPSFWHAAAARYLLSTGTGWFPAHSAT